MPIGLRITNPLAVLKDSEPSPQSQFDPSSNAQRRSPLESSIDAYSLAPSDFMESQSSLSGTINKEDHGVFDSVLLAHAPDQFFRMMSHEPGRSLHMVLESRMALVYRPSVPSVRTRYTEDGHREHPLVNRMEFIVEKPLSLDFSDRNAVEEWVKSVSRCFAAIRQYCDDSNDTKSEFVTRVPDELLEVLQKKSAADQAIINNLRTRIGSDYPEDGAMTQQEYNEVFRPKYLTPILKQQEHFAQTLNNPFGMILSIATGENEEKAWHLARCWHDFNNASGVVMTYASIWDNGVEGRKMRFTVLAPPFHLDSVLKWTWSRYLPLAQKNNVQSSYTVEKEIVKARFKECEKISILNDVIENLVINAIRYHDRSRLADRSILSSAKMVGNEVVVEVKDNGMGMEADTLRRFGEVGYRAPHSANLVKGTGLGAGSIIEHVMDDLQASFLQMESKRGQGTVIRFGLPSVHFAPGTIPFNPNAALRSLDRIVDEFLNEVGIKRQAGHRLWLGEGVSLSYLPSDATTPSQGSFELQVTHPRSVDLHDLASVGRWIGRVQSLVILIEGAIRRAPAPLNVLNIQINVADGLPFRADQARRTVPDSHRLSLPVHNEVTLEHSQRLVSSSSSTPSKDDNPQAKLSSMLLFSSLPLSTHLSQKQMVMAQTQLPTVRPTFTISQVRRMNDQRLHQIYRGYRQGNVDLSPTVLRWMKGRLVEGEANSRKNTLFRGLFPQRFGSSITARVLR